MPLSKEFYLDEIKSKYPNSYNESLKDLPIKDLEDMLDFLEGALSKADGGSIGIEVLFKPRREEYQTGGRAYDSRATAQDFAKALQSVSAGTTYQQQEDAKRYARQQASSMLNQAMKSADPNKGSGLQGIYDTFFRNKNTGIGPSTFTPGASGRMMSYSSKDRDRILDQMANQMLSTTSYAAPDPFQKRVDELDAIRAENQRIVNQYMQNNQPALGVITGPMGGAAPSPGKPLYEDQALLSQLTKLTPLQATYFDPFEQLSDIDQYNLAQAFPQLQSKLRNPNFISSSGPLDKQQIFERIYGLKDGGRVGLFMGGPALEGQALAIYNSMNAYGFSDQEIADTLSARGMDMPSNTTQNTSSNIIGSQLKSPSGGDGFSVFNPEPNRVKSFTPEKSFASPRPSSNLSLQGDYDIYGKKVKETLNPLQAGIRSVRNTMANVLQNPVIQTIGSFMNPPLAAVKGIASMARNVLPVNPRAITENIAGQQGIIVDDIGRIVSTGKYTDPTNVMAGYNLSQMTEETFDTRTGNIAETLADKYGMTPTEIQQAIEGTYTGPVKSNLIETIRAVNLAKTNIMNIKNLGIQAAKKEQQLRDIARANKISRAEARETREAIDRQGRESAPGRGDAGNPGGSSGAMTDDNAGTFCFDPNTLVQMADGSEKKIKEIQLGDQTKGGEVTGVFQFKASDEIHDYKGVVVAGSHYVKEDGKFIMVQDSPISVKIDKIPVVYSLDTTGRRIFINDIEFADYNGDGVAKNFLTNAGVDLTGFDTEVLRQVEQRLI